MKNYPLNIKVDSPKKTNTPEIILSIASVLIFYDFEHCTITAL